MRTLVQPVALSVAFVLLPLGASWAAEPDKTFTPPVTFENREGLPDPQVWFARESKTGRWCAFDRAMLERQVKLNEIRPGESGWARFDAHGLRSVTYARESEDAYTEDRYFTGPAHDVERIVRTGHYIRDPWVSVTFEPEGGGRFRLTPVSKSIVLKMDAHGWETYFVNWDHFSKLRQLPFAGLLERQKGEQVVLGC